MSMFTLRPARLSIAATIFFIVATVSGSTAVVGEASAQSRQSGSGRSVDDPFSSNDDPAQGSARSAGSRAATDQSRIPDQNAEDGFRPTRIDDGDIRDSQSNRDDRDNSPTSETGDGSTRISAPRDGTFRKTTPPGEFEKLVSQIVDKPIRRFGSSLLVPGSREFRPSDVSTIPGDYRINPGDQLVIGLTGSVIASNLKLKVDQEGRIFIPKIGSVDVGGVRYDQLNSAISRQVARYYRGFGLSVAMGRLNGITIFVTGFASTPGSYVVNSVTTLSNALFAAGGPSAGGSFRSIQVRRGNKVISDFDLYDLLLKGDRRGDIVLQNGDVVFVAPVGSQVAVIGSANQEAIFEAAPGDTLTDVIRYAGGVNTVADNSRILVIDPLNSQGSGWQELTPEAAQTRVAKRGEVIRILSDAGIASALSQQPVLVTISGEVTKPGRYYFRPGVRMEDVVAKAGGLTADAYPYATVFTRQSVQLQQRISYKRAIGDIELALTTKPLVSSSRNDQLQTSQLALVQSVVSQLKSREPDGRVVLDIAPGERAIPSGLVLENNDSLYIPPQPATVGVFGAVPSPASFKFTAGFTVGEYLRRSGGFQRLADKSEVFVVRANGTVLSKARGVGGVNVLKASALPGDLVFVPIRSSRGEFWERFRDVAQVLATGALTAATITSLSR